ncbi:HIT family protein [Aequorivita sp. KMM 9714]|uniref:HIT family protein n=1 Tax=Aequorivita sp. KMM 9714 TaxID=2707173 RepID=UPI0013EE18F3|nr:HIT family protein [Aequorivita sp. KMM 9714]NGX84881.1 HIT family protein [Aequorivita sp. KMM 9714]
MSVFSKISNDKKIYSGEHFFLIYDGYPVSPGHILIISNEEKLDYFSLSKEEQNELNLLIEVAKEIIEKDQKPDGYNIGMNCGKAAGQTVMHFHCHVIPRYFGDMENPRGGIRHCIKGKGYY